MNTFNDQQVETNANKDDMTASVSIRLSGVELIKLERERQITEESLLVQ